MFSGRNTNKCYGSPKISYSKGFYEMANGNSADPDQTATLFAIPLSSLTSGKHTYKILTPLNPTFI